MPERETIRLCGALTAAPRAVLLALGFLLLAIPLGAVLAVQVPLGHVPDEPGHVMRAAGLLHGELRGRRETAPGPDGRIGARALVRTDAELGAVMTLPVQPVAQVPMSMTRQMLDAAHNVPWVGAPVAVDLRGLAGYFPLFYVPAAAAIGAVRLAGGSPYGAYLATRLANLAVFALLGGAGLLLARRNAGVMACALLLPMTLNLAASASPDGLLVGCIVLALACVSRAAGAATVSRSGWYRGAAVLLGCVAATKLPYLPVAALLLLPLDWRAAGRAEVARRLGIALLACLPALLWAWWAGGVAGMPHDIPVYEAGPLWPGPRPATFAASDPAAQLRVLLAAPWRLLTVPAAWLGRDGAVAAAQMVGVLGWLNIPLPAWLYAAWGAALGAAALADLGGTAVPQRTRWLETALLLAAVAASALGILLALYLTWTPVGDGVIEGVQGRYFLPLLPLLGRALPAFAGLRRLRWLLLAPLGVAALDVLALPRLVLDWYYLR